VRDLPGSKRGELRASVDGEAGYRVNVDHVRFSFLAGIAEWQIDSA
jgi:hypothetical protein